MRRRWRLFGAQRDHRIDARGLLRGTERRQQRDDDEHSSDDGIGQPVGSGESEKRRLDEPADAVRDGEADAIAGVISRVEPVVALRSE